MNYVSPSKCEISQHSVQRILLHNSGSFATLSWANKRDCFRFRYEKAALITRKSRHRLPRGLSNANTAKKKVVGTRSRWRIGDSTISPNQVEGLSFQSQGSLAFHLWQSQFPAVNSQSKKHSTSSEVANIYRTQALGLAGPNIYVPDCMWRAA